MKLRKNKATYDLPKDVNTILGVHLSAKGNKYLLTQVPPDFAFDKHKFGIPNYFQIDVKNWQIVFSPTPQHAWKAELLYLTAKIA